MKNDMIGDSQNEKNAFIDRVRHTITNIKAFEWAKKGSDRKKPVPIRHVEVNVVVTCSVTCNEEVDVSMTACGKDDDGCGGVVCETRLCPCSTF